MSDNNDITILGGGWSAALLDLQALRGLVIGVNDAVIHARCDVAVSMDRLWATNRWHFLQALARPALIRTAALKGIDHKSPKWLKPFECDHKSSVFSTEDGVLNGTNSGACAMNAAYAMDPKRIFLIGFDMNRHPETDRAYWFPDYPWATPGGATKNGKYAEWSQQFDDAASAFRGAQIEVFNVSMTSAIRSFPKMSPEEYARL